MTIAFCRKNWTTRCLPPSASERKGRRNFDPSANGRYTTTVCNLMARKDADPDTSGRYALRTGWIHLLGRHAVEGAGVFDLEIVATMLANGVQRIYASDTLFPNSGDRFNKHEL